MTDAITAPPNIAMNSPSTASSHGNSTLTRLGPEPVTMLAYIDEKIALGEPVRPGFTWKPLGLFNLYRLVLCCFFLFLTLWKDLPNSLGKYDTDLFYVLSVIYLAFSITCGIAIILRRPSFQRQLYIQVVMDIVLVSLIMHTSGGIHSGMGTLLVVIIAAASLLSTGQNSLLFAGFASLALLIEQTYADLAQLPSAGSYAQLIMLCATFFATALLARVLAQRTRVSEALASQRGVELDNMSLLTDYIIERMQTGVMMIDNGDNVLFMNESAATLLGRTTKIKKQALGKISTDLTQQLKLWRDNPVHESTIFRPPKGSAEILPRFSRLGMQETSGILVFLEDTARVAQQAQHLKLASLGKLTASIAHEIRNPLAAISHAGQLLEEYNNHDKTPLRLTQIISEQSQRMNKIVENVLQLSRRDRSHPEDIEIKEWLKKFTEELTETHEIDPEHIGLECNADHVIARVDPSHLHQILWNLCDNGLRYTVLRDGLKLKLRAGIVVRAYAPYLEVVDFGPGIAPTIIKHLFEPFCTTEESGTGLGLYISRELAECNQARLSYRALPDGGSCFRVTFADPRRKQVIY